MNKSSFISAGIKRRTKISFFGRGELFHEFRHEWTAYTIAVFEESVNEKQFIRVS